MARARSAPAEALARRRAAVDDRWWSPYARSSRALERGAVDPRIGGEVATAPPRALFSRVPPAAVRSRVPPRRLAPRPTQPVLMFGAGTRRPRRLRRPGKRQADEARSTPTAPRPRCTADSERRSPEACVTASSTFTAIIGGNVELVRGIASSSTLVAAGRRTPAVAISAKTANATASSPPSSPGPGELAAPATTFPRPSATSHRGPHGDDPAIRPSRKRGRCAPRASRASPRPPRWARADRHDGQRAARDADRRRQDLADRLAHGSPRPTRRTAGGTSPARGDAGSPAREDHLAPHADRPAVR